MKKLLCLVLLLVLLTACGNDNSSSESKRVGILQLATHDALDASRTGFVDALKDGGYIEGENLVIDYQNPEADQANLSLMAETLLSKNPDVVLAIATAPAQTLYQVNNGTPILGTAITDFVASGLANSNEKPGKGIAGVSDGCPMTEQLDLLLEVKPDIKKFGIVYTSSEPNSEIQAKQMQAEANARGIEVMIKTVSDKTMIDDTMQAFVGEVEAIYVPTDNNIASAMASVDIVASENNIIVMTGESNPLKNGGLMSLGVNYYEIGYQTGQMAVKLLNGETTIDDLTIETQKDIKTYYNSNTATKLGITLPSDILENGIDVIK